MFTYLYTVERGGSVIATHTVQNTISVTQLVCGPATVHVRHWLPGVSPGTESFTSLKTHCPIIASNTVEMISQRGHSTR